MNLRKLVDKIPEFCLSHWLLRVPLAIVFLQQGLSKLPFSIEDAEAFGLPSLVWWFVILGELGAGIGLLVGGIIGLQKYWNELGDLLSRFCGITICSIMTGVIWVGQPESFWDVILYDNLHLFLWVGGMYFALRGNRT